MYHVGQWNAHKLELIFILGWVEHTHQSKFLRDLGIAYTGVANLLASLGHTGIGRVVLDHILNTQTLMKTDEQKKGFR